MKVGKNKLYVIAGERNMFGAVVNAGLFANVGQTTRTVYDRIKDDDYRLKSAAGTWKVIIEGAPLGKFEDAHVHELLRGREDVKWNPESSNTEEFHFITDKGDGEEVKRIIKECLNNLQPHLIEKDIDIVKSKLETVGVRHASEFNGPAVYWFRVRSFVDRVDSNGKTYLIINFINNIGSYKSIFCWAWHGEYPKIGSTFITQVKKGKRSLTTSYFKLRPIQNDLPAEVLDEAPGISDVGFFCNYDELIAYYEKEYKVKFDKEREERQRLIDKARRESDSWWSSTNKQRLKERDDALSALHTHTVRCQELNNKIRGLNNALWISWSIIAVILFYGMWLYQ